MNKIILFVIAGDRRLNRFMEAADLFEAGKVLGQIEEVVVSYKEGAAVTAEIAEKLVMALGKAEQSDFIVSFVHFDRIVEGNKITYNGGKVKPYWNKAVRIISTGQKWFMLHEFIKRLGFKVETDEHMYITSIS